MRRQRSLKVYDHEWDRWQLHADSRQLAVSTWLRTLANEESDRLEAEARRTDAAIGERNKLGRLLEGF